MQLPTFRLLSSSSSSGSGSGGISKEKSKIFGEKTRKKKRGDFFLEMIETFSNFSDNNVAVLRAHENCCHFTTL